MIKTVSRFMILVVSIGLGACTSGNSMSLIHEDSVAQPSFASGSVGFAAHRYSLSMDRVRSWYGVVRSLHSTSLADPTFHLKLDFRLDEQVEPYAAELRAVPAVSSALQQEGMSPEEFIFLTVLIGTGWRALQIEDSSGRDQQLLDASPELLEFFRHNEPDLTALHNSIATPS